MMIITTKQMGGDRKYILIFIAAQFDIPNKYGQCSGKHSLSHKYIMKIPPGVTGMGNIRPLFLHLV